MKSNLPRSAVWAKRRNESNSMWLPAAGSLHTVVLFTPGKCAARWICLIGLLIGDRFLPMRLSDVEAVAVRRPGQAEQSPQGGRPTGVGVAGPERAAPLQLGYEAVGDLGQVVRQHGRAQPEPGQPRLAHVKQQVGQLGRGAREDAGVACVPRAWVTRAGPLVEAVAPGARGVGAVVEEHGDVAEQ